MKNTILIVLFNYSNCLNNVEFIKSLYEKHFKKVIFYSDIPEIQNNDEVNFVSTRRGFFAHRIFYHFYQKYKYLLDDCDGLFYTMDDNILNVNLLKLMDTTKIIYYYKELKYLNSYSGGHWTRLNGKKAIRRLPKFKAFKTYNINTFSGCFADWFYLPRKYLTEDLFILFELFAICEVFLEIAIPSIIHNIEPNKDNYSTFSGELLGESGMKRLELTNKNYLSSSFNNKNNLIIHPIKFNEIPESKDWLKEIFHCKEKCVIITTINKPTEAIFKHINNTEYDTIIVGDKKTPNDYVNLNCIFLDVETQKNLFPKLCEIIPYNHYCRKNLGYLYAFKKGYNMIYETDDDNVPYDDFDNVLEIDNTQIINEQDSNWINIFKYFTNNAHIWPRGFPLTLLKNKPNYDIAACDKRPSIVNGLVENDPDVDACFRLICNQQDQIIWEQNKSIIIDNKNMCVFNTQNTFWLNPELFVSMLIPCSVSFRYCDILRGIITNIILKKTDNYMMYTSPNVIQNRNEHNLFEDLKSELEMYVHNENILDYIEHNTNDVTDIKQLMNIIYQNLLDNQVITQNDIDILTIWLDYF